MALKEALKKIKDCKTFKLGHLDLSNLNLKEIP